MVKTQTAKARDKELKAAIRAADVDSVRRCLAEGASVKAASHGLLALGLVVFEAMDVGGRRDAQLLPIAELLAEHGADLDHATKDDSVLHFALRSPRWVDWLLAHGANPNGVFVAPARQYPSPPPLAIAVVSGLVEQTTQLLAAGAHTDFICRTSRGTSWLLKHATRQSFEVAAAVQQEIITRLLEAGGFCAEHASAGLNGAMGTWDPKVIGLFVAKGIRPDNDIKGYLATAFAQRKTDILEEVQPLFSPDEWQQLSSYHDPDRPSFGVLSYPDEEKRRRELAAPAGAIIRGVMKDSAAWVCGLRPRDAIVKCGGNAVTKFGDLSPLLAERAVGDALAIEFWRAGEVSKCALVLQARGERGSMLFDDEEEDDDLELD